MKLQDRALSIPEELTDAQAMQAVELARIWWGDASSHMTIRPALTNPGHTGAVLAEAAWHFSNAYAAQHDMDQAKAFAAILDGWTRAHAQAAEMAESQSQ
jgi:hypothetical protein